MAKRKDPAKPLFAVKHDFYASLDALSQEAILLVQAVEMALQHGQIPAPIAEVLKERVAAFSSTLLAEP